MNKFIKQQLENINTKLSNWDDSTSKIFIPKQGSNNNVQSEQFVVGSNYNIIIENYIINPPPNFSLASNWNFNTIPPEENLIATVLQIMGNMIKFKCIGKTTQVEWIGWLPRKSIKEVSICR